MAQAPLPLHRDEIHFGFIDFQKNEGRNLRLHQLGADPASPVDGLLLYRTDTNKIRARINGAWQDLATMADVTAGGISANIVDAKGDLIVATADNTVTRKAVGANNTFLTGNSVQADGLEWRALVAADIPNDAITFARMQNITTDRLLGRDTAGSGDPEEISVGGGLEFTGTAGIQRSALTGDVTAAAGSGATTIANAAVTLAKMANLAANSIIGNNTGSAATPIALTPAQVKALLAIVPGDITGFDTQVRTSRLDQMAAPTAAVPFNSQRITGLADGVALSDAATLGQVLSTVEARKHKDPVDAATTGALPAVTYNSGAGTLTATANGALPAQDGVTLAAGDSLLVKNQASTFQGGIYDVTQVGSGAAPFILTRRADASTATELSDATTIIEGGTTQGGDIYTQTNALADLTAAAQVWTKTGDTNVVYTADGSTIVLTGNSFGIPNGGINVNQINAALAGSGLTGGGGSPLAVNVDAVSMEIVADAVRIAAAAAGAGLTGGGAAALAVGQANGILVNANDIQVDPAVVMRKATGTLTGGANSEVLTHNLNTRLVKVSIRNNASPFEEIGEVYNEATSVNTVTVYAGSGLNLPAGYTWVVMG